VNDMSHTCHVRYVYAWRYDDTHVHILTIVIWGGGSCRIHVAAASLLFLQCARPPTTRNAGRAAALPAAMHDARFDLNSWKSVPLGRFPHRQGVECGVTVGSSDLRAEIRASEDPQICELRSARARILGLISRLFPSSRFSAGFAEKSARVFSQLPRDCFAEKTTANFLAPR
jgi:hypothetical protein